MNYKNPFIKVSWTDTPENFTSEKINRVKTYFQKKYNTRYVNIITVPKTDNSNTKLSSLDISENISNNDYQKSLMKDFIEENKINIKWELIDRLDNKVNEEISKTKTNKIRFNKWFIKKIEFSNFLSYGQSNVINFEELDGITVVESTPKNFGGKSTATVDLLMFLFFNSTTKTKTNIEIFNRFSNENEVIVKGYITIDNEDYVIERSIIRKKTKSGDYNVTNKLEFYKIKENGEVENLNGEQRKETETFIESAIGSEEDFLSTILSTGANLEELIESKPTARGLILTKFIGLDALKMKEDKCKEIYSEWSKKLVSNTYNIVQLEDENLQYQNNINEANETIVKLETTLRELDNELKNLELKKEELFTKRNNDIDQELVRVNPVLLEDEINSLIKQKKISQNNADNVVVKEPLEYFFEDDFKIKTENQNKIFFEIKLLETSIEKNIKTINQFKEGLICPSCKRPLDDHDHTNEINELNNENEKFEIEKASLLVKYKEISDNLIAFTNLKKQYEDYEKNKLIKERHLLEIEQKELLIETKKASLKKYHDNKKKLDENRQIDSEVITVKTRLETTNANIKVSTTNLEKQRGIIKLMTDKIVTNQELIKKIKIESDTEHIFKTYLTIFGKNGISKVILRNMIPLLNQELYRLLVDSCHFILELNINDKNELEFVMIDSETRIVKPLTSGSGYERTISSLALRAVLTKISSLPKPNIVVMDEVFGKIADENLEMVGEFFKKIKKYFDHIFVISHNPLIRNWSDNIVMVKKLENISSIEYITTKIS